MSAPDPIPASELLQALKRVAGVLNQRQTNYALIGGLGVAMRGTLRATRDIDMLVSVPQIELPRVLESLGELGFRVDLYRAIRSWNEDHLLEFVFGSIRVGWIKAVLPIFHRILERARWEDVGGATIRVADAEGLLLMKLIPFRPRDQEDIRGILAANPGCLDLDWVRRQWAELTTADDPRSEQFEQLVREFYEPRRS